MEIEPTKKRKSDEISKSSGDYWDAYSPEVYYAYWNDTPIQVDWMKLPGVLFSIEIISWLVPADLCRIGRCCKKLYQWSQRPEYWQGLIDFVNSMEAPGHNLDLKREFNEYQTMKKDWLFSTCGLKPVENKTFYGHLATKNWMTAMRYFYHRHLSRCINLKPVHPDFFSLSLRVYTYVPIKSGEEENFNKYVGFYDIPVARHKRHQQGEIKISAVDVGYLYHSTRFVFEPISGSTNEDYLYWYGQKFIGPGGLPTQIWSEVSLVVRCRKYPQGIEVSTRSSPRSMALTLRSGRYNFDAKNTNSSHKYNFSDEGHHLRITTPSKQQMVKIASLLGGSVDSFLTRRGGHFTHQSGSVSVNSLASNTSEDLFYDIKCGQILKACVQVTA